MSTFVKTDYELLAENFEVIPYHYIIGANVFSKVCNVFKSLYISLKWVWRVDAVYVWFGGYHGFFPVLFAKLLSKKSIIIVGGYDASYVPSIHYGVFYNKGFLLWCIKRVYTWATYVCPVDESLVKSTNYYADPSGIGYPNGILNHMKLDESKIKVIPTGYDGKIFKKLKIEHSFDIISVGYVSDGQNFIRKGFDLIFELAKELPHLKIVLVGFTCEYLDKIKPTTPSNITLVNFVPEEELIKLFSSSKIVLQLSMAEGLPNTLCEAMLCECIPIGSDVNGIPKAIGNTGFVLKNKNIQELVQLITNAVKFQKYSEEIIRQRIINLYPFGNRKKKISYLIKTL
jgi:glycosyltransferase involved in cell wall biosynthesis